MAYTIAIKEESSLGRSHRSVLVTCSWSLGAYRLPSTREGEVEVVNEDDPLRSLLLLGSSLGSNYAQKITILEKENNDLKAENNKLRQELLELQAKLVGPSTSRNEHDQSNNGGELGLTYDELQKLNTVAEPAYQTGQESDASSVDEMTGQEPTLAELLSMNPVGD